MVRNFITAVLLLIVII